MLIKNLISAWKKLKNIVSLLMTLKKVYTDFYFHVMTESNYNTIIFYYYLLNVTIIFLDFIIYRKYTNGTIIRMHVDPARSHVISAIINIDQQLDKDVSFENQRPVY
jgi:hypothetical protein